MKIIWSKQNYEIDLPYKHGLVGLQHNNERPDKIGIDIGEIPIDNFSSELVDYFERCVKQAVSGRSAKVKIVVEGEIQDKSPEKAKEN